MAAQDNVRQFLATDDADDVLDVRAEIDRAAHQVGTFPRPVSVGVWTSCPACRNPRHPPITPAAMPRVVNQNEGGHGPPLTVGRSDATCDGGTVSSFAFHLALTPVRQLPLNLKKRAS
jgi:hypothetical protein